MEGKEAKIEVYHHIRVLLQETEETTFRVLLQQLAKYPQFVTRFWKMGLIAHYAILRYGLPKSSQVYLTKIELLL